MQNVHQHLPQETNGTYLKIHFPGQDLKQKNRESTSHTIIIIIFIITYYKYYNNNNNSNKFCVIIIYHKILPNISAMET